MVWYGNPDLLRLDEMQGTRERMVSDAVFKRIGLRLQKNEMHHLTTEIVGDYIEYSLDHEFLIKLLNK